MEFLWSVIQRVLDWSPLVCLVTFLIGAGLAGLGVRRKFNLAMIGLGVLFVVVAIGISAYAGCLP